MPKVVDNRSTSTDTSNAPEVAGADIAFTAAPDVLNFSFKPEPESKPAVSSDSPALFEVKAAVLPDGLMNEIDKNGVAYAAVERGTKIPSDVQATHLVTDVSAQLNDLRAAISNYYSDGAASLN